MAIHSVVIHRLSAALAASVVICIGAPSFGSARIGVSGMRANPAANRAMEKVRSHLLQPRVRASAPGCPNSSTASGCTPTTGSGTNTGVTSTVPTGPSSGTSPGTTGSTPTGGTGANTGVTSTVPTGASSGTGPGTTGSTPTGGTGANTGVTSTVPTGASSGGYASGPGTGGTNFPFGSGVTVETGAGGTTTVSRTQAFFSTLHCLWNRLQLNGCESDPRPPARKRQD